jgi:hypothetical protein
MDITKCLGENKLADGTIAVCPKRSTCVRYTAKPHGYQSWMQVPVEEHGDKCEYYMAPYKPKVTK